MIGALLLASGSPFQDASPPIPLERTRRGLYCVRVTCGSGVTARFVVDTGSYRSFVTHSGAVRLRTAGAKQAEDGAFAPKTMVLSGFAVKPVSLIEDEADSENPIPKDCEGILGNDLWSQYRVGLDLSRKILRLWPAQADLSRVLKAWFPTVPKGIPTASLGLGSDGSFYVPVRLEDRTVRLLLDTGCPYSFVAEATASALGWSKPVSFSTIAYASGSVPIAFYQARSVEIGGLRLPGTPLIGATATGSNAGTLGTDVLLSVRALLDFPGRRASMSLVLPGTH